MSKMPEKDGLRPQPIIFPIPQPGPPPATGPPIESSTTFKYGDVEYKLDTSTLAVVCAIGYGAHGYVQKMQHAPSQTVMAVKMIPFTSDVSEEPYLLRELKYHIAVADCTYIVEFFGAFLDDGNVSICMELMDTPLDQFYKKVHKIRGRFQEDVLSVVAFSVLKALDYLYRELRVIHRDVKPSNVLLNRNGSVKMCDFGISGQLINSLIKSNVGTESYLAPERVISSPESSGYYGITSDVWSFGITMFEVATGKFPYSRWMSFFDQIQQVVEGDPPRLPSGTFSTVFEEFVGLCLQKNAADRPKYEALLDHAFVKHLSTTTPVHISSAFVCDILDSPSPTSATTPST